MITVMFWLRFLIGGLVVASIPVIDQHFGSRVAGLFAVLPVLVISGFIALGLSEGSKSLQQASIASIYGQIAIVVLLVVVYFCIRAGLPVIPAVIGGLVAWLIADTIVYLLFLAH